MRSTPASSRSRDERSALADLLAQRGGVELPRLRLRQEGLQDGGEALRLLHVREVPGVREQLEPAARHRGVRTVRMVDRDDRIALAPDQQRRQARGEVEPVVPVDALAAGVDDRTQALYERRTRLPVRQREEALEHLADVAAGLESDARAGPADPTRRPAQPARREEAERELAPRQRGCTQQQVHLAA